MQRLPQADPIIVQKRRASEDKHRTSGRLGVGSERETVVCERRNDNSVRQGVMTRTSVWYGETRTRVNPHDARSSEKSGGDELTLSRNVTTLQGERRSLPSFIFAAARPRSRLKRRFVAQKSRQKNLIAKFCSVDHSTVVGAVRVSKQNTKSTAKRKNN